MQDVLTWLIALGVGVLLLILRFWLPKYFEEKAKNLAQKEDLDELTSIVEDVKSRFERGTLVYRAQFEAEFSRSQKIWEAARRLQSAFVEAFPHPDFSSPTEEKFSGFVGAHVDFLQALEGSRPFLPTTIIAAFCRFDELMVDAKSRGLAQHSPEELSRIRKEVDHALEVAEQAIRTRLQELQVT